MTGYLFSRGKDGDAAAAGEHLGIGGTSNNGAMAGKLLFFNGNAANTVLSGRTNIPLRTWHHVVLVRDGHNVKVFLDGQPDIDGQAGWTVPENVASVFLGGRCDNFANFEGKLDEVSLYDRALYRGPGRTAF